MKNIIKNILKDNDCFYYKLDKNTLSIRNEDNTRSYVAAKELANVSRSLGEKNINHNVDENQSIHIIIKNEAIQKTELSI